MPTLTVYSPRTSEVVELLTFYEDRETAAEDARRPTGRLSVPPRRAINNVLVTGFWNERDEILSCLKP